MTNDISAELADGSEYTDDEHRVDVPDKFADSDLEYEVFEGTRRGSPTLKLRARTNGEHMVAGTADKRVAQGVARDDRVKTGKGDETYELVMPAHLYGEVEEGERYTIEEVLGEVEVETAPEPRDVDTDATTSVVSRRVATDGGVEVPDEVPEPMVRDRIQQYDDPEHEDANTVADVGDAWRAVQEVHRAGLDQHVEYHDVVAETTSLVVFDTGTTRDDMEIAYEEAGVEDEVLVDILDGLMHDVAREYADHDWSVTYPLVVTKSREQVRTESYVRQRLGQLVVDRGGAARGLDYWATKVQGLTFSQWERESGRSTGAIGNSISRGEE